MEKINPSNDDIYFSGKFQDANIPAYVDIETPLCFFLGLYAPAPAPYTPDDWVHHGEENVAAWVKFVQDSVERGYFAAPIMENDTTEGMK